MLKLYKVTLVGFNGVSNVDGVRFDRIIEAGFNGSISLMGYFDRFYIIDGIIVISRITVISRENAHTVEISLETIEIILQLAIIGFTSSSSLKKKILSPIVKTNFGN